MLTHGQDPYDSYALIKMAQMRGFVTASGDVQINPYVYLPFTGLVMSPLTLFDPVQAMRIWFFLNQLFLLGSFILIFLSVPIKFTIKNISISLTMMAVFYPLHRTLTAGQVNLFLLFLFSLVFYLNKKGWPVAAGAVSAFAFLFKLIPGILLLYFIWQAWSEYKNSLSGRNLLNKGTKSLLSMIVISAVFLLISIFWVGLDIHKNFLPVLNDMGYGRSTWSEFGRHFFRDPENQSFNSLFHHLFYNSESTTALIRKGSDFANGTTWVAVFTCIGIVVWSIFRSSNFKNKEVSIYGLMILLALLVPSIYWDHYAVIAIWPLFIVFSYLNEDIQIFSLFLMLSLNFILGSFLEMKMVGLIIILIIFFLLLIYMLMKWQKRGIAGIVWAIAAGFMTARFVYGFPLFRQGIGLFAMSIVLWGTLLLYGLLIFHLLLKRNECHGC